ncbi:SHKBP1 [Symbiodinium sp. CCMP2592]|nr:SHKBP1 [Symbiodinium sp. CCMP2592]
MADVCLPARPGISGSDQAQPTTQTVRINIGGERLIEVHRGLFSVVGDNKLSALLSGRWELCLDDRGNFFVDYSPEVFMPLIEWLRLVRDSPSQQSLPFIAVDERHRLALVRMMVAMSFELPALRSAGVFAAELISYGFGVDSCVDAGYCVDELLQAGATLESLWRAGVEAHELKHLGLSKLRQAGYTAKELKHAGFDGLSLLRQGVTVAELIQAEFTPKDLRGRGAQSATLIYELSLLGFTATELRAAGFSASDLTVGGFTATQLRGAGFSAIELKESGFSAAELREAGFTAGQLAHARFFRQQLEAAGFDRIMINFSDTYQLRSFKTRGFLPNNLPAATVSDLRIAGFSATELRQQGFDALQLLSEFGMMAVFLAWLH